MHLTGIALNTLLQAAGILGGIVVVFYILKLKRRPIAVPFAPLWERVLRDKEATTLFSQLKRLLSLLLQLCLLGAMLFALGDPRPAVNETDSRHVVVLIDASASMKATDVTQPPPDATAGPKKKVIKTRLDQGKEAIREVVRGLSGNDRMLIAQMDAGVAPLSTMTDDIARLEEAIDQVKASDVRADFPRALRFAVDSLRDLSRPEIIVVSDGALDDGAPETKGLASVVDLAGIKLSHVKLGKSGRNVAVTGFSVRRYPLDKSRYEVLLEVTNTSDKVEEVEVELYGDGQLTDIVQLRLQAKESLSRFYPNLSGADKTLEARIRLADGVKDDLPADDRGYALLPERRRARVQVVTRGNMYLEAALLLDEYLEVVTVSHKRYPAPGKFDVTIFDERALARNENTGHVLYLDPGPKSQPHLPFKAGKRIKSTKRYTLGFDELETKSPILRHVSLGDVNIGRARELEGKKRDKALGKSFKGTMLLKGRRKGFKFVALGFDIRESDLPLRISWPLLLLNIINDFLDEDTSYISSFRTGEVWRIPAVPGAKTGSLELPGGGTQVVPIKDGRAVFLGQHAGFYKLTVGEGKDQEVRMFAGNLSDRRESAIAPKEQLEVGATKAGEVSGFEIGVRRELWIYLLALVIGVTAIEWLTYHRRLTV